MCVLDKNTGISPEWIDLGKNSTQFSKEYDTKLKHMESLKKQVSSMKSTIKSGKHIDKFFDTLIQNLIETHANIKQDYRERADMRIENSW